MKLKFIFIVLFIFFIVGCNQVNNEITGSGIVVHMNLEGGFYGIITDGGDNFLPENLTSDFQQDSLRIVFEGIITDQPTIAMWGRTIRLTKIERAQ